MRITTYFRGVAIACCFNSVCPIHAPFKSYKMCAGRLSQFVDASLSSVFFISGSMFVSLAANVPLVCSELCLHQYIYVSGYSVHAKQSC